MIEQISKAVDSLKAQNLNAGQIAKILTARGTKLSTIEVQFLTKWSAFKRQAEAAEARNKELREARTRSAVGFKRRRLARMERLEAERKARADERLKRLQEQLGSRLISYTRAGCQIDRRGRVKPRKLEAAE
jgi:hypothetical protein